MKIFKTYAFRNLLTKELEALDELIKISGMLSVEELQALRTLAESARIRYRLVEQLKNDFYNAADRVLSYCNNESDTNSAYATIIAQIQQKAGAATGLSYYIEQIYCTDNDGIVIEVKESDPALTESVKNNAQFLPAGEAKRILEGKITTNNLVYDISCFIDRTAMYA